jgi:tellurite resistance protein TerC
MSKVFLYFNVKKQIIILAGGKNMEIKNAIKGFGFWVLMALIFNLGIYFFMGSKSAMEFFGGYIIEQSLSVDNLFLFLLVFGSFGLPAHYQKRVLNFGIIGAMLLRLVFILLGINIVNKFHWILYIFGLILIISGIKMFFSKE